MINKSMFFTEPTIKDYREIKLEPIIREFLYTKGTWNDNGKPINKQVYIDNLLDSALYVYGLKHNETNKRNILWYIERAARQEDCLSDKLIYIPQELWAKCDEYNKAHIKKHP